MSRYVRHPAPPPKERHVAWPASFQEKRMEAIPQPSESAWAVLRHWFASEAAQVEGRAWKIAEEKVDAQGVSSVTGDQLASLELSEADTHTLLAKVESLVRTDEKRIAQWDEFKAWLDASGPFGVVIDAANVGYFNQNFDGAARSDSSLGIRAWGFQSNCATVPPTSNGID